MASSKPIEAVPLPGSALTVLAGGVSFLQPEDAVLEAMLEGWVAQQRSRLLTATTVENRCWTVRRFVTFTNDYPW
ncbi:MAG: tyrosine-type recombinase/integrase, partial [Acidimicrobiia bacterium]